MNSPSQLPHAASLDVTTDQTLDVLGRSVWGPSMPWHVVVVGAGMSGLVAAGLLKRWGYRVTLLEGSNAVGGRVKTIRTPFSPPLYCEAGAMRIPKSHRLAHHLVEKVGLTSQLNLFKTERPENLLYVNGVKATFREYWSNPDILRYPVRGPERGKRADQLWSLATREILESIFEEPVSNWPKVVEQYDRHSVRSFLTAFRHDFDWPFSEAAVEMMGVLLNVESGMMNSFLETLRDQLEINGNGTYYEILGGNDQLPREVLRYFELGEDVKFRARLLAISQTERAVTLRYSHPSSPTPESITCDAAVITIPFSALRMVGIEPGCFSPEKMRAIRSLHYDTSTKVMIEFKSRFWEREHGIRGGHSVTDLPIRFVYYPNHGFGDSGPSTLTASYTWSEDSLRWDSLSNADRVNYALRDLAVLHGDVVYDEFRVGTSYSWLQDPQAGGAFALFGPEQQTQLHQWIAKPEGRCHFAGEHTTLKHGWIEGAIESGVRAAIELHPDALRPEGPGGMSCRGQCTPGTPRRAASSASPMLTSSSNVEKNSLSVSTRWPFELAANNTGW